MTKQSFKISRKVAVLPIKAEAVLLSAMELREAIFELGDSELVTLIDLLVCRGAAVSQAIRQSIATQTAVRVAA